MCVFREAISYRLSAINKNRNGGHCAFKPEQETCLQHLLINNSNVQAVLPTV